MPVTFGTNLSPRDANRRYTTSRRAQHRQRLTGRQILDRLSAEGINRRPNTSIKLMFEY
ncbi:hypothetical protein I540_0069 [Mycobacteroides abscessus subsp. bolletii 1513]|uniref:Uncharacterized protein n=1 Tax=Mycobacteroides abscessus subsp. bolletii 1513 TaxID=1299321 RepID=X8DZX7_9MYCO|nr:hypothetical protein I540_0069 [Mycobacteroides abscessus subsp. bolletii 1513]